ncbi:MAG: DUF2309 domain-containing protein [Magnetococcales bacterium]|nr:DUF2309 domain-containing protein [Magnetococcales bacterium]
MQPEPLTDRIPMRQQLLAWLGHLEHHLPGQAPLGDFIHHNTLHGFQPLPFAEALQQARRITGLAGYWPVEQFRASFAQGRIDWPDLEAELRLCPDLQVDELVATPPRGPLRRLDLYRILLLHDLAPLEACQLRWQQQEHGALSRLQADLAPEIRQHWRTAVGSGEAAALTALWQLCLAPFDVYPDRHHPEAHLEDLLGYFSPESVQGSELDKQLFATLVRDEATTLMDRLLLRLGPELTLSHVLALLTGEDIFDSVRPLLVRHVAAYLDQGMAAWPYPDREKGFFAAWRSKAMADWSFVPEELTQWREEIRTLSDDPVDSVMLLLGRLGLPEKQWTAYLERLALRLPGWSGMVSWRANHPGYEGLCPERVQMMDYLAISLVLERLYALRLCRRHWQLEPRLELLQGYFARHSGEFLVRWSLYNEPLPEYMASYAEGLLGQSAEHPAKEEAWYALARMLRIGRHGLGGGQVRSASTHAWPLFLLAQHLGMTPAEWARLGRQEVELWLDCLQRLNPDRASQLWLYAYERHYRNQIFNALLQNEGRGRWLKRHEPPAGQLIFCMDEREEGIRRHLEEADPQLETLGAAGFFGVPIYWQGLADRRPAPLCPVVVTPAHQVREEPLGTVAGEEIARTEHPQRQKLYQKMMEKLDQGTRLGLLSPLWVVLAAPGALLVLIGKLLAPRRTGRWLTRLRGWFNRPVAVRLTLNAPADAPPAVVGQPRLGFTDQEQAERVANFLRSIGLTDQFAPLVVLVGHGSSSQNNPHRAAYNCGACSGRHGGPNARVFAAMANRPAVRALLSQRGIRIPAESWFLGAEHNTASEAIHWFDLAALPPHGQIPLARLQQALTRACAGSAQERSRRLASAPRHPTPLRALNHVMGRSHDFSQSRPELGHVTNAVALIGRRAVVQGLFLDRRMFLISYDPSQDPEGTIVENILLAAGPVGAGISLEYYFSTVNNAGFGSGSKVTHNVTGFLGVMEGTDSDLRTGLPKQMIEIHEAMRLLVIVEQSPQLLSRIHARQEAVRELVDNGWIVLAAKEPEVARIHLFRPGVGWQLWSEPLQSLATVATSAAWYQGRDGPLPPVFIAPEAEAATHG